MVQGFVYGKSGNKANVLFLVSKSVNAKAHHLLTQLVLQRLAVRFVGPKDTVALVSSTGATLRTWCREVDFSDYLIRGFADDGAGADTIQTGIVNAMTLFQAAADKAAQNLLVIVPSFAHTDGPAAATALANLIQVTKARVISVPVGPAVDLPALQVLTPEFQVPIATAADADTIILAIPPYPPPAPKIDVIARHPTELLLGLSPCDGGSPAQYAAFTVRVLEQGRPLLQTDLPLVTVDNLLPGKAYRIRVKATLTNGTETDWSEDVHVTTVKVATNILHEQTKLEAEVRRLLDLIRGFEVSDKAKSVGITHYNVALIGKTGSGKSSLINSFNAVLKGRWEALAVALNSITTVTRSLGSYSLSDVVNVIDPFGFDGKNYKGNELEYLSTGVLEMGYEEGMQVDLQRRLGKAFKPQDCVHAWAFAIKASTWNNEAERRLVLNFRDQLSPLKYTPQFGVTMLDMVDKAIADDTSVLHESGPAEMILNVFRDDGLKCVFPVVNITESFDEQDLAKEYLILKYLYALMDTARSFVDLQVTQGRWKSDTAAVQQQTGPKVTEGHMKPEPPAVEQHMAAANSAAAPKP